MLCTVQAEWVFGVVSYASYVLLAPDHMPRGAFWGASARMTLFKNDAVVRTRSGFQDFPIFTKTTFDENGVLASTGSEVPFSRL